MTDSKITPDNVRELFDYEPETGRLIWRKAPKNPSKNNNGAGSRSPRGYIILTWKGRGYLAHRVIWMWMTAREPACLIDHIDGDPSNNRWCNLREATFVQNSSNRKMRYDAKSGVKGVSLCPQTKRWKVQIQADGKNVSLGRFDTIEEAARVYRDAAARLHGAFARFQ